MILIKNYFLLFAILFSSLANADGISKSLSDFFSSPKDKKVNEILAPDAAFKFYGKAYKDNKLIIFWEVEPGYYLYKNKFNIKASNSNHYLSDGDFPKGKIINDVIFGETEIYNSNSQVEFNYKTNIPKLENLNIEIGYQGCKENSICYPPIVQKINVIVEPFIKKAISDSKPSSINLKPKQDQVNQELNSKSLLFNIVSFFGYGLLLAFTPCVFPMFPILSGIIIGQGKKISRSRAISLSLSYIISMALTYAVLGVVAALLGVNLQAAFQNPWILTFISGMFVIFALSMFGFFNIQMPTNLKAKLALNNNSNKSSLKKAALTGVLSAIIVGPCLTPPLAGALLYISQTGNALSGGVSLFSMGLGIGLPLLIVGANAGELLPKAGAWMGNVKNIFGVMMLGLAIWFLERVIPSYFSLLLWATLFIISSIFIGALDRIDTITTKWQKFCKGFGVCILVYGVLLIISGTMNGGTVLEPFKNINYSLNSKTETLEFKYIKSIEELNSELSFAKENNQLVMLDFYADWCVVCHELENEVFSDAKAQTVLRPMKLLKIDVTKNNIHDKALLKKFGIFGPPAILFFNADGKEIKTHRIIGFIKIDSFIKHVKGIVIS